MIFYQLFEKETSTYTYLLADERTKEAILIDPVIEMISRDSELIEQLDLNLKYILETHVHADHITASGELKKRFGAKVAISSAYDMSCVDLHLDDGQILNFGSHQIIVHHTPGHTSGCLTYQIGNMIFTGDALLIRGCGRTDFQEGSSDKLFESVRHKLFLLPDETLIYPGHDYKGFSHSTVGFEKKFNSRLKIENSKEDFIQIMQQLKLANPKKIHEAVPANLNCGLPLSNDFKNIYLIDNAPTMSAENFLKLLGHVQLIDVRGEDEFNNELGHIPGAQLVTLGEDLEKYLKKSINNQKMVFVCRSGKRSLTATKLALHLGFKEVFNLEGGMLKWNELRYPVVKDLGGS